MYACVRSQAIELARKTAEAAAATRASGAPTPAPRPDPAPPHSTVVLASMTVSLADRTGELDRLNTPIFLDLSQALKTPQATYKAIYPGSSGFDDSNRDPMKIFKSLVTIADLEISEKNTIDRMLKRPAGK